MAHDTIDSGVISDIVQAYYGSLPPAKFALRSERLKCAEIGSRSYRCSRPTSLSLTQTITLTHPSPTLTDPTQTVQTVLHVGLNTLQYGTSKSDVVLCGSIWARAEVSVIARDSMGYGQGYRQGYDGTLNFRIKQGQGYGQGYPTVRVTQLP